MPQFKIYNDALTRFIRDYHSDLLGSREWGDGTATEIIGKDFWHCAEAVWGLTISDNYNPSKQGYFLFKIIDINSLRSIGLAGFGEILPD